MEHPTSKSNPMMGAFFMLLSGLSFVGVYVFVKYAGQRLPAVQFAWLRYVLGLVFLIPIAHRLYAERISADALKIGVMRGAVHSFSVATWFFAMSHIPLAEVSAMGYLTPVFVTIFAVLILGERFALRRAIAIVVAIIGVLIILRPGFREISTGHLAMITTTMGFGFSYIFAKKLTDMASTDMIVALLSVTVTIGLTPLAIAVWVPPNLFEVSMMFIVAVFATMGHYTMTAAFRSAPITVTQPVAFLQLLWAVIFGYALFSERIDGFVILGGLLIISAVLYITLRAARLKQKSGKGLQ